MAAPAPPAQVTQAPQATLPDAGWRARLRARMNRAPQAAREPWWLRDGQRWMQVGSLSRDFVEAFQAFSLKTFPHRESLLQKCEHQGVSGWCLALKGPADGDAALAELAQQMRAAGLCGKWRDELLTVHALPGQAVAVVERAAVRPLGIATHAVHLVGWTVAGQVWVQQRAWDKATDPGRWDTLMGGMVPARDSLEQALARETWEEAGLRLADLRQLSHGGQLGFSGPTTDSGLGGHVVERIDWFDAELPPGLTPVNQDGEVAQFACLERSTLVAWLQEDRFTLEAAAILCDFLESGRGLATMRA